MVDVETDGMKMTNHKWVVEERDRAPLSSPSAVVPAPKAEPPGNCCQPWVPGQPREYSDHQIAMVGAGWVLGGQRRRDGTELDATKGPHT